LRGRGALAALFAGCGFRLRHAQHLVGLRARSAVKKRQRQKRTGHYGAGEKEISGGHERPYLQAATSKTARLEPTKARATRFRNWMDQAAIVADSES
jgi:hypothetical protein